MARSVTNDCHPTRLTHVTTISHLPGHEPALIAPASSQATADIGPSEELD